jgi:hypothetical protein
MPYNGSAWIDNLHVRVDRPWEEKRQLIALLQPTSIDHRLYLTSVTLQGDAPEGQARGLDVKDGARVYAQGVHHRSHRLRTDLQCLHHPQALNFARELRALGIAVVRVGVTYSSGKVLAI